MNFDDILFKQRRNGFFFFFDELPKQLSFAKMKAASMERHGLCPKFKNFELVELLEPSSH
jgi:hypothetical protein